MKLSKIGAFVNGIKENSHKKKAILSKNPSEMTNEELLIFKKHQFYNLGFGFSMSSNTGYPIVSNRETEYVNQLGLEISRLEKQIAAEKTRQPAKIYDISRNK